MEARLDHEGAARSMIHVIVDGVVYGLQRHGGINTYFNQILPRLAARDDATVDLFVPRAPAGRLPGGCVRRLPRDFLPSRTGLSTRVDRMLEPMLEWSKLAGIRAWAGTRTPAVFQSTYFTWLPASVPCVAMVHDMNHETFPHLYATPRGRWLRRVYPEYLGRADRIIAVSESTKRQAVRHYGLDPQRIDVIYHAVDPGTFYAEDRQSEAEEVLERLGVQRPYVLYVGGRWHYKNFSVLLDAMPAVNRRHNLRLVVAGSPWNATEAVEMPRHPAGALTTLVPVPEDDLLRALYNHACAFVFPSLQEGFGIPILEAMACGTPVVAADTEVFREVAGGAAIYFDPQDRDDLVRALGESLDETVRRELTRRATEQIARYSWDRTAAQTLETYRRVLSAWSPNSAAVY